MKTHELTYSLEYTLSPLHVASHNIWYQPYKVLQCTWPLFRNQTICSPQLIRSIQIHHHLPHLTTLCAVSSREYRSNDTWNLTNSGFWSHNGIILFLFLSVFSLFSFFSYFSFFFMLWKCRREMRSQEIFLSFASSFVWPSIQNKNVGSLEIFQPLHSKENHLNLFFSFSFILNGRERRTILT